MKNKVLGILALILSVGVLISTTRMKTTMSLAEGDPGPWLFPVIAAALIAVCGASILMQKKVEDTGFLSKSEWVRLVILYGIFLVYAVSICLFGFLYSSIVMLFVTCTLFAGEKKIPVWIRGLYALVLGIAIWYLLKVVFSVPLPAGFLLE